MLREQAGDVVFQQFLLNHEDFVQKFAIGNQTLLYLFPIVLVQFAEQIPLNYRVLSFFHECRTR
jgi:hypothetical protein